jgi:hypothetical protein
VRSGRCFLKAAVRIIADGSLHGYEQVLFAREAAVDSADSDARPVRDLVDRRVRTALGEELMCRLKHTLQVAAHVFALAPPAFRCVVHLRTPVAL